MKYNKPALDRQWMAGLMGAPSITCAVIKCAPGYVCIDGECVPL